MPSDNWWNKFHGQVGAGVPLALAERIEGLGEDINGIILDALMEGADKIIRDAWGLANVSPGVEGNARDKTHMRDNIRTHRIEERDNGVSLRIGVDLGNVPYAADQEFGPRGKPYLRPAFDENREYIRELVERRVRQELGNRIAGQVKVRPRFYRGSQFNPREHGDE